MLSNIETFRRRAFGHLQTFADDSFGEVRRDCGSPTIRGPRYDAQATQDRNRRG